MLPKIWTKYTKLEEIKSNSNFKTYLARIEIIVKIIILKDENEYYLIKEKLEKIKNIRGIYEIIEEKNKIYIVMDNNPEMIFQIDELIEGILAAQRNPFETTPIKVQNSLIQGDFTDPMITKATNPEEYYSSPSTDTPFLQYNPEESTIPVIDQTMQVMNVDQNHINNLYGSQQMSDIPYSISDNPTAYPISNIEQISYKPALNEQIAVMTPSSAGEMTLVDNQNFGSITSSIPPVVTNPAPSLVNSTIWNNGSILPTTSNITSSSIMTQSFYPFNNSRLLNAILDEDFRRRRPVYDEYNRSKEDLYRSQRSTFGNYV
jgi:hypothetical protein